MVEWIAGTILKKTTRAAHEFLRRMPGLLEGRAKLYAGAGEQLQLLSVIFLFINEMLRLNSGIIDENTPVALLTGEVAWAELAGSTGQTDKEVPNGK